jgi:hypothetical protein
VLLSVCPKFPENRFSRVADDPVRRKLLKSDFAGVWRCSIPAMAISPPNHHLEEEQGSEDLRMITSPVGMNLVRSVRMIRLLATSLLRADTPPRNRSFHWHPENESTQLFTDYCVRQLRV